MDREENVDDGPKFKVVEYAGLTSGDVIGMEARRELK